MNEIPEDGGAPAPQSGEETARGLLGLVLGRPAELPQARLSRRAPWLLLALGGAGCAGYGALSGFFSGGAQVAIAAFKGPLVVALGLALCLPSFVVFHLLAGGELGRRGLVRAVTGFAATLGLLLAALGPLAWLFSISSRYLTTAVLCHLAVFAVALGFAVRFLGALVGGAAARRAAVVWSVLFWLTTVQLATYLGPVLVSEPEAELFPLERESFLSRFGDVVEHDDEIDRAR